MIPNSAEVHLRWIAPEMAKHDDQPIDGKRVRFWVAQYRKGGQYAPPILNADLTIRNGRHRLLAMDSLGIKLARVLIVKE